MDGTRARAFLGVREHASHDEMRRAFRARAKATHPDLGGDPEAFRATLHAFRLLAAQPVATEAVATQPQAPHRRVDTYDCEPPARRTRPTFADVLDSAVRQRVARVGVAA